MPYGTAASNTKSGVLSRVTERSEGFRKLDAKQDEESLGGDGSEIELNVKAKGDSKAEVAAGGYLERRVGEGLKGGITVRTDVDLRIEEVRAEIERENLRSQGRM